MRWLFLCVPVLLYSGLFAVNDVQAWCCGILNLATVHFKCVVCCRGSSASLLDACNSGIVKFKSLQAGCVYGFAGQYKIAFASFVVKGRTIFFSPIKACLGAAVIVYQFVVIHIVVSKGGVAGSGVLVLNRAT